MAPEIGGRVVRSTVPVTAARVMVWFVASFVTIWICPIAIDEVPIVRVKEFVVHLIRKSLDTVVYVAVLVTEWP
jgi:hypothetical protein